MAEVVVPFEIDEDDVNTLDGTAVTLATITADDAIAYVPSRLEIWRKAGTAYTVTKTLAANSYTANTLADDEPLEEPVLRRRELIVYSTDDLGADTRDEVFFRIPVDYFLDRADANGLVVFPEGGLAVHTGDITLKIESLIGLVSGTGDLQGRVYFEQYQVK
jgi:hypothetical protein